MTFAELSESEKKCENRTYVELKSIACWPLRWKAISENRTYVELK